MLSLLRSYAIKIRKKDRKKRNFNQWSFFIFESMMVMKSHPTFLVKNQWMCMCFFFLFFCQWHQIRTKNFQFLLFFSLRSRNFLSHRFYSILCRSVLASRKYKVFNQYWLPDMAIEQRCVAQPCNIYINHWSKSKWKEEKKIDKNT